MIIYQSIRNIALNSYQLEFMDLKNFFQFFDRAESVLKKIEPLIPQVHTSNIDWSFYAFRWKRYGHIGHLAPIKNINSLPMEDLLHIDYQKLIVNRNTKQFLNRKPANHLLMTGAKGTGKSSLIKSILGTYCQQGLRLIEIDKSDLVNLSDVTDLIRLRKERYIIFCDDLSFERNESGYKELKSALDGSISEIPNNALVYATSNRRHFLPEYTNENEQKSSEEIHIAENIDEKISLSERFGIWISFYPFNQDNYLDIVKHWLIKLGDDPISVGWENEAIQWALHRGSRSGRIANQFARDWLSRNA